MKVLDSPLQSLADGTWFKLICGASFQHLPAIRDLVLAYSLAGADCIDVAADPAVITMAKEALAIASDISQAPNGSSYQKLRPLLMMSVNDAEDPHFRKALFDPDQCPSDCPRPCEKVCPAIAIDHTGVISDRCYGCGRCIPICPLGLIDTQNYVSAPRATAELIVSTGIDALEIHTQVGHFDDFKRLWQAIAPVHHHLKLLAISCQNHPAVLPYLNQIFQEIQPLDCTLLWQTDGRPMSGDIGKGTIHASIQFAQKLLQSQISGYVQLAGGTNDHTITKLKQLNLFKGDRPSATDPFVSGIAFGSYARKKLQPILEPPDCERPYRLEHDSKRLWQAVSDARDLVNPLKS
ncbi:4Fe-4S ferredoxin iron-sulfur binding domain-containing protein [[Leptolyngbya] sp. PCC 7376]|uniref:circadian clock protein LdpA n=1 Tax=[Leptolyngbya] sp. PCC 7376 TaxID=111781 RepID=UPI00029F3471|nr:LdpA C-terminal domain-containing domain [[Leptolyngbya] sp. PCC 7376]AFY37445.1 4Fe-4S ferredoxin iron-sulfur binding domain-containing protein [[Leptolyngbya] sp. PCC 7376]